MTRCGRSLRSDDGSDTGDTEFENIHLGYNEAAKVALPSRVPRARANPIAMELTCFPEAGHTFWVAATNGLPGVDNVFALARA